MTKQLDAPVSEVIAEAVELTGFKESVITFLLEEFLEGPDDESDFFEHLGEMLGDASFIIAASKGFGIDGCLAAYDYGYQTVNEGLLEGDLESVIDDIELKGIPSTED
jgi:hypothetical protein